MEVLEVDGVPVGDLLEERYRYIPSSTHQDRQVRAFRRLLKGPPGGNVSVKLADLESNPKTVILHCTLKQNRKAAHWLRRSRVEFRQLGDSIAYVALNTFGSRSVVEDFDRRFDEILAANGLIIDVRENGGGSTGNAHGIIARLIDRPITETSIWRTRQYRPTFEAWGKPQEWHEGGDSGVIEPRGEERFLGPVAVLIGPKTFSAAEDFLVPLKATARATLIGTPTAGSTGQPLIVPVFGTSVRICTKWDRFPDGSEFVGVGIRPDVSAERTREDVIRGSDPVLEAAVSFLRERF